MFHLCLCLWLCAVTDLQPLTKGGSAFLSLGPRKHAVSTACRVFARHARDCIVNCIFLSLSWLFQKCPPPCPTHPSCTGHFVLRGRESGSGKRPFFPKLPPRMGRRVSFSNKSLVSNALIPICYVTLFLK